MNTPLTRLTFSSLLILSLSGLLFAHFATVDYQENEPSTIGELTFTADQFFNVKKGSGPTADITPMYYAIANGLGSLGLSYKEIRALSVVAHALSVGALIWYLLPYASLAVCTLLSLILFFNPLLLFYATQLRFWSLSTAFIVVSMVLLLAMNRGRIDEKIRPLIWLLAFLSCATTLTSFTYFCLLAFIDGRAASRDRRSRVWMLLLASATLGLLLVKLGPALHHRFVHRAIERPEIFVLNTDYLTTMFSMYAIEFATVGTLLIATLVTLGAQRSMRQPIFLPTLTRLFWGALATQLFFLFCASLPAKEIASRYAMWTIFVFIASVPEILNSIQKPLGKLLLVVLLVTILAWELVSTAWFVRYQDSMFQPWEATSREILREKKSLAGVCLYPKFIADFLKYSSPPLDWSQWDSLIMPTCPNESVQNYTIRLYWNDRRKIPPDRIFTRQSSRLHIENISSDPGK